MWLPAILKHTSGCLVILRLVLWTGGSQMSAGTLAIAMAVSSAGLVFSLLPPGACVILAVFRTLQSIALACACAMSRRTTSRAFWPGLRNTGLLVQAYGLPPAQFQPRTAGPEKVGVAPTGIDSFTTILSL